MDSARRSKNQKTDCSWMHFREEDFLSGTLSPEERARWEGHVGKCSACREEFAVIGSLEEKIAESGKMEVPAQCYESLWPELRSRLEREEKEPESPARRSVLYLRRHWRPALAFALAAASIVALIIDQAQRPGTVPKIVRDEREEVERLAVLVTGEESELVTFTVEDVLLGEENSLLWEEEEIASILFPGEEEDESLQFFDLDQIIQEPLFL